MRPGAVQVRFIAATPQETFVHIGFVNYDKVRRRVAGEIQHTHLPTLREAKPREKSGKSSSTCCQGLNHRTQEESSSDLDQLIFVGLFNSEIRSEERVNIPPSCHHVFVQKNT